VRHALPCHTSLHLCGCSSKQGQLPAATPSHLCEPENVVNEQQHILALNITEVLSNGQTCTNTGHRTQHSTTEHKVSLRTGSKHTAVPLISLQSLLLTGKLTTATW
jgi:hypothetical protein